MPRQIYKIKTTAGERYAIGIFSNGSMLAGSAPKYYKTKKRAQQALKKL